MAKQVFTNNARATLQSAITAASTSIALATGKGALFASPTAGDWQLATITDGTNYEIVKITARSTDTLTVTRAQESTSARAWSANALIYAGVTKGTLELLPQNLATGSSAIALGNTATATDNVATALGNSADATGAQSVAVGDNASATHYAVGVGSNANASGQGGMAVGYLATASGQDSVAIGATSSGYKSIAIGSGATASQDYALAEGYIATASALYAVAIGNSSKSSDANSVAVGSSSLAGFPTTWLANTAYSLRQVVKAIGNDHAFICVTAGTSGLSEPSWNTAGGQTTDGTVVWQDLYADSVPDSDIAIGASATAYGVAVAIGKESRGVARSVAIGRYAAASGYSVALGGGASAFAGDSIAIGYNASCTCPAGGSYGAIAIGESATVTGDMYCMALGTDSVNRITESWTTTGAPLVRKDNGENLNTEHQNFASAEAIYFSKEIDLKSLTDDIATITIPTGATFYPNEIGLVITSASSVTGNPDVSFGVTGNTTSLLASTTVTAVAAKNRTVFTLLSKHGVNSLTASVKTAATGTTLLGRFYWVGMLVEDE